VPLLGIVGDWRAKEGATPHRAFLLTHPLVTPKITYQNFDTAILFKTTERFNKYASGVGKNPTLPGTRKNSPWNYANCQLFIDKF